MNNRQKFLFTSLLGFVALAASAFPATAATSLGTASGFAVLSAAPGASGQLRALIPPLPARSALPARQSR